MRDFFEELIGYFGLALKLTGIAIVAFTLIFLPIGAAVVGNIAWALLLLITIPFTIAFILTAIDHI